MISSHDVKKSPILITKEEFGALDELHQALTIVMARDGRVVFEGGFIP